MRRMQLLGVCAVLAPALSGCGDDGLPGDAADGAGELAQDGAPSEVEAVEPEARVPPSFCEGETRFAWDPDDDTFLAAFPSDALSIDDASARTGLRVKIGQPAWLTEQPQFFQSVWRQLESLDGFGTSAGIVLRFSAAVAAPESGSATATSKAILLLDLSQSPAEQVPYETEVLDEGQTIIVWPMRPLIEEHLHGLVVTNAQTDAGGDCIAPSAALRAVLGGEGTMSASLGRLQARFTALVEAAAARGVEAAQISAATVFTTQSFSAATLKQREHLRAAELDWKSAPTCTTGTRAYTACKGDFFANDYRIEGYLGAAFDAAYVPESYRLPVHIWLPKERLGPVPVLVFGHGLGGDAEQAELVADLGARAGFATLAVSAPRHGDHPTATSSDPQAIFTSFFGVDLGSFSIDGFVFRENLRQAAFDKLQAIELVRLHPDIDGDGEADLDLAKVGYWGISLGGILGPNFIAMSEDVSAVVLSIAGARLISIVTDGADFAQLFGILATLSNGRDNLLRQSPVAQTLIDGADPVGWASHILTDTFGRSETPPHVLVQMVMDDSTVPNIATRALARALDVPQVPVLIAPIDLLAVEAAAPVQGNLEGGVTGGIFQLDRVTLRANGNPRRATHSGVFSGIEAIAQVLGFFESWLGSPSGTPTINDPYAENGTPPL